MPIQLVNDVEEVVVLKAGVSGSLRIACDVGWGVEWWWRGRRERIWRSLCVCAMMMPILQSKKQKDENKT